MIARHLVAAPDKFKGTASASAIAAAAADGTRRAGWTCAEVPMADGGDGLLDAVGGEVRHTVVARPDGKATTAEWRLLDVADGRTAVIEMAKASGLTLAGGRGRNDAVGASTAGTGELVLAAVASGARRIVVGCGGSATTDGGAGAVGVIGSPDALRGAELLVAVDVTTAFVDAARLFAPQKGARPSDVAVLTARLEDLVGTYRRRFGVDVASIDGAGAAGGLAGGLAALGGRVVSGFDLVADLVGLDAALEGATLVMTGEGQLDPQSFAGKVVGGIVRRAARLAPVCCVAGRVSAALDGPALARAAGGARLEAVDLTRRFGRARARAETAALVAEVVAERLSQEA